LREYCILRLHVLATTYFEQSLYEDQDIRVEELPKS
jgi:hypothetical protein